MKKNLLLALILVIFLFVLFGIQSVYAIDLNLINSIQENEISISENLSLNTNTSNFNSIVNSNSSAESNNPTEYNNSILPSASVSNVTNTTDGSLTIGNILNILLVVVGVLLILLGIAILIRMNR